MLCTEYESQATTFFFQHFTVAQDVDKMSELYTSTSRVDKPGSLALVHSIRAQGLAGLSRGGETPKLMRMAEGQYLNAIRAMNSALFDTEEAKKDSTLLAVLVLTIFETFTNHENQSLLAWGNHIQGAAALLEARGKEQFQSREGLRLFIQATVPICTSCMQFNIPLPTTMSLLMREALVVAEADDTALVLLEHKLRFVIFWNSVRSREITELVQIVQKAKQLDDELVGILEQIKAPYNYNTIQADTEDEVTILGYCHVFEYFLGAECWNGAWASRILLNQMIRSILLIGFASRPPIFTDDDYTALFQETTNNLFQIQNDVTATVPQYLGYLPNVQNMTKGKDDEPMFPGLAQQTPMAAMAPLPQPTRGAPTSSISTGSSTLRKLCFFWIHFTSIRYGLSTSLPSPSTSTLPVIRTTGGALLPWVMFLLATTDIATDRLKTWVSNRLDEIGRDFGIHHSLVLANRLRSGNVDLPWYRNPWNTDAQQTTDVPKTQTSVVAEMSEMDLG